MATKAGMTDIMWMRRRPEWRLERGRTRIPEQVEESSAIMNGQAPRLRK